ncbi:hypothetical protein ES702_05890 [subsurface metagenome]
MAAFWQKLPNLKYGKIGTEDFDISWGKQFTPSGGVTVKSEQLEIKQKKPAIPIDLSDPIMLFIIIGVIYLVVRR